MNIPNSLLDDLEAFVSDFVDGAPDASIKSKTANFLSYSIREARETNTALDEALLEMAADIGYGG